MGCRFVAVHLINDEWENAGRERISFIVCVCVVTIHNTIFVFKKRNIRAVVWRFKLK